MRQSCSWMVSWMLLLLVLLAACQPIQPVATVREGVAEVLSTAPMHVFPFAEDNLVAGTLSTLKRTPEGVYVSLETKGLSPGHTYTLWWVVFNYPNECSDQGCIPQNLMEAKIAAMVKYGIGAIADETGAATFETFLAIGDITGALDNQSGFDFEVVEPAPGLIEPFTAEFHVVLRSHGAALADPSEQLTTFNGGCNPECFNVQVAMHVPSQ